MENTCDDLNLLLLPQDILIQILVLLPVISLLRFKSVCKSWRALIQSSFFIDLHLNNSSSSSSKFGTFIFQITSGWGIFEETEYEAFMLSSGGGDYDFEKLKWENLGFPPCYRVHENSPGFWTFMVGSCNGLICIHDTQPSRDFSLWNPATIQFRLLPKSLTTQGLQGGTDFALFGYDVKTKDYKVVQISWFKPYCMGGDDNWIPIEEYIFQVQVYNLSTDSWRLLEGINSFPGRPHQGLGLGQNHGVYLNGSYYFLAGCAGSEMILSFDFTKEIFTTIQIPRYHMSPNLTYLGEKLGIFATLYPKDDYDIWVLNNEHGGGVKEESWTKIHSIQLNESGMPRGISNDGEFAFIVTESGRCLQLFNLVTREVKKEFRTEGMMIRAYGYKQSLVSICGNGATSGRVLIGGAL